MEAIEIDEIFLPHASLRSEQREHFIGRASDVSNALSGLASQGAVVAIIGERGIGKTSTGWRIREYLASEKSWLTEQGMTVPFKLPEFDVMWLEVTRAHQNIYGIMLDMLTDRGTSRRWNEFTISDELAKVFYQDKIDRELSEQIGSEAIDAFKRDLQASAREDFTPSLNISDHIESKVGLLRVFQDALSAVSKRTGRRLLLILDELDRLTDRTGLGDFLKTGNEVQVALIGVADDISEIVSDHTSSDRKVFPINIDRFSLDEVSEFIQKVNEKLSVIHVAFDDEFKKLLWDYSDGFPYICQRLGRDALLGALQKSRMKITEKAEKKQVEIGQDMFFEALDGYLSPKADPLNRHARLRNAVSAVGKEQILFALAKSSEGWMSEDALADTDEVSSYNFGRNLTELVDDDIIVELHGEYRFIDPQMRAIVKLTMLRDKRLHSKKSKKSKK